MSKNQTKSTNALINESSTYLLQHAHNPVDWQAWTEEALASAVKLDRPIMLSIGYSACHWCHVMEEESFADQDTAKMINDNFVPIKVDREERPDIDDVYMTAVQLMTGHGGWPLTVFLTPQLQPFFGGTYFPKEDRHYGQQILPGFKTVLRAVSESWQKQRSKIETSAGTITAAINSFSERLTERSKGSGSGKEETDAQIVSRSANNLLAQFDKKWGGFGHAPKFPQTLCILLCLRHAFQLKQKQDESQQLFLELITTTLNSMASGGIYDHLGGGFARYSTDEQWLAPHFEKMLYDNALLAQTYIEAYTLTGQTQWRQVACETLDFISRELTAECHGFYCSLDADSEGEEGKFYVWSKSEIDTVLDSDSDLFCQIFGVTESGNFEHGKNILHLSSPVLQLSKSLNLSEEELSHKVTQMKAKLFAHRRKRIPPIRDEKILTSWNGLSISAFVSGYKVSGQEKYLDQAKQAANFILNYLKINNRLKHNFVKDAAKLSAYLDDYAFFVQALIDLASVDSNPLWLKQAVDLTDSALKHFYDQNHDDFFYTADDHEKLISRPKNHLDGPIPSATSVTILNLLKLYTFTNNQAYKQCADKVLAKYKDSLVNLPSQYANMISAWDFAQSAPLVMVLVTSDNTALNKEMLLALHKNYLPNRLVIVKDKNQENSIDKRITILSNKDLLDKRSSVYICHGYNCQAPVNDLENLRLRLNEITL